VSVKFERVFHKYCPEKVHENKRLYANRLSPITFVMPQKVPERVVGGSVFLRNDFVIEKFAAYAVYTSIVHIFLSLRP
jgi:hypothetical protein